MAHLFVPPSVAQDLQNETARRTAEALKAVRAEHTARWVAEFNRELQNIDSHLKLVWAPDPLPVDAVGSGARPGRWHVMRHNPGTVPSFLCIEDNGEYVDPDSRVFERLRSLDWWNAEVNRDRRRVQAELERARERREAEERKQMDDQVIERYKALNTASVSMNRSTPWTQNRAGKRGAKR
jgi:hypothetical protein